MQDESSLDPLNVGLTPLKRFEQFVQSRGKRMTDQRRIIVETIFSHHDHFDAEDLMVHLRADPSDPESARLKVARPTVYRTLSELVDAGLLTKMHLGGRAVYEHGYGYPQHDHLHCMKCLKLIEFKSEELADICDAVALEHNFHVSGHRLMISGICADCQAEFRRPGRSGHSA